jgi:hypothetical protein
MESPHARGAVPDIPVPDEIHIWMRLVGRQAVDLEVAHGERKRVVDADDAGRLFRKELDQPIGQGMARPVSLGPRWKFHFFSRAFAKRLVDSQAFEAALCPLGAGIGHANGAVKTADHSSVDQGKLAM